MTEAIFKISSIDEGKLYLVNPHPQRMSVVEALKRSIAKWYFIFKHKDVIQDDDGTRTCALCAIYYSNECRGCPVKAVTKQIHCKGSPYDLMEDWDKSNLTYKTLEIPIRAEIHFLEELLTKAQKNKKKKKAA